jgi:hypothetical protein
VIIGVLGVVVVLLATKVPAELMAHESAPA